MQSSKALRLIGLALKAKRLEVGVDPVSALAATGKARLVLVANDASPRASRRLEDLCEAAEIRYITAPFSKAELGAALGRAECSAVATSDAGFARSIAEAASESN